MRVVMLRISTENTVFLVLNALLGLASVFGFRERHEHHDHMHRPRFLSKQTNFSYHIGETATLFCSVEDLGTKTVTWRDSQRVLTVGEMTFAAGTEYEVKHLYPESPAWNLIIKNVQPKHQDTYECQVSTVDKMTRVINLTVLDKKETKEPDIQISGPFHIDKGLTIRLECNATGTATPPDAIDWFKNGNKVESNDDGHVSITKAYSYSTKRITSMLEIHNSKMEDTGTYTCRTSDQVTSVNVHILNAEKAEPRIPRQDDGHLPQPQSTSSGCTTLHTGQWQGNFVTLLLAHIVLTFYISVLHNR